MDITIQIPTNKADEVKAALGYRDEILDEDMKMIPNPETPKEFLENYIKKILIRKVNRYIDSQPENKSDWKFTE